MNLTLIQCSSGRYTPLQRAIANHHQTYCDRHGYNYLLFYGRPQTFYDPTWDKVKLLQRGLTFTDKVVWMDSDSLIVDVNTPLEAAFLEFQHMGHCIHNIVDPAYPSGHFNCGVGFYRDTKETREYLSKVWDMGVVPHPTWHVQSTMLKVGWGLMQAIDDKWNSTVDTNVSPNPVIESWHGHNQDFTPIYKRLDEVTGIIDLTRP